VEPTYSKHVVSYFRLPKVGRAPQSPRSFRAWEFSLKFRQPNNSDPCQGFRTYMYKLEKKIDHVTISEGSSFLWLRCYKKKVYRM
jgi:hypothetical protein